LPFFLGRDEAESMPIPDRILASGNYNLEMLAAGGTPTDRLEMGGAWRYLYALDGEGAGGEPLGNEVLVCLPDDDKQSDALLCALIKAFGSAEARPHFHVKFHPTTPERRTAYWRRNPLFSAVDGDLKDWVRHHRPAAILFVGSTVGVEFALQGFKVLQYLPETFIGHDPMDALPPEFYSRCTDRDIRERVSECLADRRPPRLAPEEVRRQSARIWGRIDEDRWLAAVR